MIYSMNPGPVITFPLEEACFAYVIQGLESGVTAISLTGRGKTLRTLGEPSRIRLTRAPSPVPAAPRSAKQAGSALTDSSRCYHHV
jgi:hypothetical protein